MKWMQWNPQKYNPFGDKWSRCAAGRLLAFAGGIIGSSILTHRYVSKRLEVDYAEQLEEVKEYYASNAMREYAAEDVEVALATVAEEEVIQENMAIFKEEVLEKYGALHVNTAAAVNVGRKQQGEPMKPREKIRFLTQEEFEEEHEQNEKVSVLWYEEDQVLIDPFDERVENWKLMIGDEFHTTFHQDGYQEVVYVRNEVRNVDYEIELVKGSYNRDVLGFITLPEPRKTLRFRDEE